MMIKRILLSSMLVPVMLMLAMAPAPAQAATVNRWFGAWVPGTPGSMTPLAGIESKMGSKARVVHYFTNVESGFDSSLASKVTDHGSVPLVTLEFWNPSNGVSQSGYSLKKIAGGSLDSYLKTYAKAAKAFGKTMWLRPFHEMNGNWYPWGGSVNGNSATSFKSAWKHVRNIFKSEGATNVKFIWCPNASSVPNTSANALGKYWPGASYVDYVAIDGYNWGGSSWTSFSGVFTKAYAAIKKVTSKTMFIAETGSSETGGSKSAWVASMFKVIPSKFPRIHGVVWFDENKEQDWRIDSSTKTLSAFKAAVDSF